MINISFLLSFILIGSLYGMNTELDFYQDGIDPNFFIKLLIDCSEKDLPNSIDTSMIEKDCLPDKSQQEEASNSIISQISRKRKAESIEAIQNIHTADNVTFAKKEFGEIVCNSCSKSILKCQIKAHISWHTGSMEYKCDRCKVAWNQINLFKGHLNGKRCKGLPETKKNKTATFVFACQKEGCDFETSYEKIYLNHQHANHNFALKCTECGEQKISKGSLDQHYKKNHRVGSICMKNQCEYRHNSKARMLHHMKTDHDKKILCDYGQCSEICHKSAQYDDFGYKISVSKGDFFQHEAAHEKRGDSKTRINL